MATSIYMIADDLLRMPDDGFHKYELVHGELRQMVPAGAAHGTLGGRLIARLGAFVESRRLGIVSNDDTGYKLAEHTVFAPDVSFVRRNRVPSSGPPDGFWDGAPDLAVEIISPSDTLTEVDAKAAEYLAYGTRMVWVLNPRNRTVTVHRPGHTPRLVPADESIDGEDVLPGFPLPLADLFAWS